jgi:thymidylate synthase (FAD)
LTPSKLYIKGSIRSWIHYLEVRTDESTQKEHREVAIECAKAIAEIFPMTEKFVPEHVSTSDQLSLFDTPEE